MSFATFATKAMYKMIRAPPGSISNLHAKITEQPTYFPSALRSLVQELASKESSSMDTASAYGVSNDEYDRMTDEMVSTGNALLKLVSESADKMGSEEVYDEQVLDLYDSLVWGFNSPFLWRIAEQDIRSLYVSNIRQHHVEIGVGTGLFLTKDVSNSCQSVTLMDLNRNSLNVCEKRIMASYETDTDKAKTPKINKLIVDVTSSEQDFLLTSHTGQYQSVAANFLFHCLHGSCILDKFQSFQNCASLLGRDGVFIGSTILGKEMLLDAGRAGEMPLKVLYTYNDWGVFGNLGDSFEDLENVLKDLFLEVELKKVGYCGLWKATGPKQMKG